MKFKTVDLISQVEKKIAELNEVSRIEHENQFEKIEKNRAKFNEQYGALWRDFANNIINKLENGNQVTKEDCPKKLTQWRGEPTYWVEPEVKEPADRTEGLVSLLNLLKAITDTEVTTTGLERIGFKDVRSLF